MKKIALLFITILVFCSCEKNDDTNDESLKTYSIATPVATNLKAFKAEAVAVVKPTPIKESGKIYVYKNYIFVNDVSRGFHIVDNSDPSLPINIGFIKMEGNHDISIKDDRLFADSYGDLVVMDISDINNIKFINRLEDAIYQPFWCTVGFDVNWPQADYYDYTNFDATKSAVTDWVITEVKMTEKQFNLKYYGNEEGDVYFDDGGILSNSSTPSVTGQGGSFARFKIVNEYLYAIESWSINVFNISDLNNPKTLDKIYSRGNIETIFNQGTILFLGGTQGMYIYDISSPSTPKFVSEFTHGRACDPVVVSENYAFVTLRGNERCGGDVENGLYIVNVSDLKNPTLEKTYPMTDPFGLGVKQEKLFICDGSAGLKVYDKSNINNLKLINHFKEIETYDVIPLSKSLLMIGDKVLYQYEYLENEIRLLSTFNMN